MHAARIDHVRGFLIEAGLDAFLIVDPPDIRWCCGFTGSSGILLIDRMRAVLITDGRYRDQAAEEVFNTQVSIYQDSAFRHLAASGLLDLGSRIGLDSSRTLISFTDNLRTAVAGLDLRWYDAPFQKRIASKDPCEIDSMRRAQTITDEVYEEILGLMRPGQTEVEIAAEIIYRHLKKGAEGMSFAPIVASGPNGALPHAHPTSRRLENGDMVVLDFGCFVNGYASDMTRTVAIGKPDEKAAKAYDVVLSAQRQAQAAARPGMNAAELDHIGRGIIEAAGYGEAFTHSLGHGLGLRVHEWPRIARTTDEILPENAVVTIEPGIYVANSFGIRIENAVLLTSTGPDPLPTSDTSLVVI